MSRILIVGDVDAEPDQVDAVRDFARLMGAAVISQGHHLMNSCRSELDHLVAEGAADEATQRGEDPRKCIIAYVMEGQEPRHQLGTVRQSRLHDWELGSPGLTTPEPIDQADVVVVVGGSHGTHRAANWTRIAGKPLLPVARFAGAGREVYYQELDRFDERYASSLERDAYEGLADVASTPKDLARDVVSLAERVLTSTTVFVAMSFADDPELEDAYETFKAVCEAHRYTCSRIDDQSNVPRILPEIVARISTSAFTIVDLTHETVNVYYELGYAEALRKPVIVTAREGTELPFDVKDVPVVFWRNQKQLREGVARRIAAIAATQGR
jgi:hypothetical protein